MPTVRSPERERVPPSGAVEPAPGRPRTAPRDPWFDNAKMLLIVLVVLGHTWSQLEVAGDGIPADRDLAWVYDFVYAFHMPAFVLITGYLSRSMTWSPDRLRTLVRTVAVPYLLFESALIAVHHYLGGQATHHFLVNPYSPMWFLAALLGWRLLTPAVLRMPLPVALGAAVAASLLSGLTDVKALGCDRLLGMLPFFVVGLRMRREDWEWLRRPAVQLTGALVLLVVLVLARHTDEYASTAWFHYQDSYRTLGVSTAYGMTGRLLLIGVSLAAALSFFALVPRIRSWFTTLGAATMTVFLFHDFAVLAMSYTHLTRPLVESHHMHLAWALSSIGAIAVALALAAPPVVRALDPLVDPVGWFIRRRRREAAPTSA